MNETASSPAPNLNRLLNTAMIYQESFALKAAVDLNLFTGISEGCQTAAALATFTGGSLRGVTVLSNYLTTCGFLEKSGDKFSLSPDSQAFLTKHSPHYMGSITNFLIPRQGPSNMESLTDSIKRGGPASGELLEENHPAWVEFARSMMPLMAYPAQLMAEALVKEETPRKVLDIAAGHGIYGISVGRLAPTAQIVGLDWPDVVEFARSNAKQMGMGERYSTIEGSAFEVGLGAGYDLVLVPNFLHHFGVRACEEFLKGVHDALIPGGRIAIVEFVPNEDRVSPHFQARFALTMFITTPGGDAYPEAELRSMLENAGFTGLTRTDLEPTPQTLLVSRK